MRIRKLFFVLFNFTFMLQIITRERLSLIKTAAGLCCPNPAPISCGFSNFEKVFPTETDAQASARLPAQACNFMLQMKEQGRPVLWIGLAAMSNLRAVLAHGGAAPDAVVQLGGAAGRADAAVRADASACSSLLQMSFDSNIPLTFITTDTGESPCLRWLHDFRAGQPMERLDTQAPATNLKKQLRQFPRVLQLVVECTQSCVSQGLPKSFEDASHLHAPLALLHALAPFYGFSPLPVVAARVTCDSLIPSSTCSHGREMQWCKECWGKWTVFVDRAAAERAADELWWCHPRMHSCHLRDAASSGGDPENCSVTVGWMREESGARFRAALLQLLSAEPPL
jgi:hypothetical protein